MLSKFIKTASISLLFLGTTFALVAQAQVAGGEGGGNAQSPVQVIVQVVAAAIVLKVLDYFDLP